MPCACIDPPWPRPQPESYRSTAGHLSFSAEPREDVRSPALLCAELRSTKFHLPAERLNVVFRVLLLTRVIYYLLTHFDALLFARRNTCYSYHMQMSLQYSPRSRDWYKRRLLWTLVLFLLSHWFYYLRYLTPPQRLRLTQPLSDWRHLG